MLTIEVKRSQILDFVQNTDNEEAITALWEHCLALESPLTANQILWLNERLKSSQIAFAEGRFYSDEEMDRIIEGFEDGQLLFL